MAARKGVEELHAGMGGWLRPARERRWPTWTAQSITGCVSVTFTGHGPRFLYFGKQLASDLYEKIVLFFFLPLPSPSLVQLLDCRIQLVSGKEWNGASEKSGFSKSVIESSGAQFVSLSTRACVSLSSGRFMTDQLVFTWKLLWHGEIR
ncbi:hypothetical protein PAHAL_3G101500 [Panicum hallii]|uniref:Uncharacterized protein n=1 Tax=Panicum hallii TaxID=206008 RepID=A0A2T8KHR9_9POAL|nr:hypothetical protein PAHAL_3G101500 [Panicum hallii]PVH61708.1 hypothetical protein PAHAL_3G101500 [Panicum hallii]PVH61709.1 hypothetical protein PAHAL_3G101500 [Panicum hallii]